MTREEVLQAISNRVDAPTESGNGHVAYTVMSRNGRTRLIATFGYVQDHEPYFGTFEWDLTPTQDD